MGFPKSEGNCPNRANLCTQTAADAEIVINFNNRSIHLHFLDMPPIDPQTISPDVNI